MSIKNNNELLRKAAMSGNTKSVKRLIPLSDPTCDNSLALVAAATFGHTECVKLLIPVSRPEKSYALYWAAYYGNREIVEMLIPVSDPLHNESVALQGAVKNGHKSCVDLLYPVSDSKAALHALKTQYPDEPQKWQHLDEREAERFNGVLNRVLRKEVGEAKLKSSRPRKI